LIIDMQPDHDQDPATTHARQSAAHWLSVLSDDTCTDAERRQFFTWLRASGQHVDEFLRLSRLNAQLSNRQLWPNQNVADVIATAKASGEGNVATLDYSPAVSTARPKRKTLRAPLAAAIACVCVTAGLIAGRSHIEYWLTPEYATTVGEQRSITLEDGSVVELNSRSRLRAHFKDDLRAIELL